MEGIEYLSLGFYVLPMFLSWEGDGNWALKVLFSYGASGPWIMGVGIPLEIRSSELRITNHIVYSIPYFCSPVFSRGIAARLRQGTPLSVILRAYHNEEYTDKNKSPMRLGSRKKKRERYPTTFADKRSIRRREWVSQLLVLPILYQGVSFQSSAKTARVLGFSTCAFFRLMRLD